MKRKGWTAPAAVVVAAGMLAAACGGDNKGGTASVSSAAESAVSAASSAAGSAVSSASSAVSSAVSSASSAVASATGTGPVIPGKGSGKYGQDASNKDLYKGAGNFQVDLSKCPSDWDPNQGITDTEIRLFDSLPKSGPAAGFGLLADGAQSYFNMVNAAGGIGGRKIVVDSKDDAYKPDQTKTNVDEAMQSGKYAALFTTLGTPNNLGIWDSTNEECMPQLLNGTGAAQWGDVENHPWTTGMQLDYFTEARLWVEWLKKNKPNAKVATITFNSDYGKSYAKGFKSSIKGTGITLVGDFPHDPTAPNIDNQYTSAAASGADTLILQTTGAYCTQGMGDVEKGAWKPTVIMSATCASLNQFFQPLVDQGLSGKDTYLIQTFKDVIDPANANDPIVKAYIDQSKKDGLDYTKTTYFTGWIFAWYMTEILQEAASYQGGLNRANMMVASRSITETSPMLITGLQSKMDGMNDAYLTEGGLMVQYKVTDPKALGKFVPSGDLLNLEGQLKTYATVAAAGE
jgi:branched-chain amino acid transport system substrate-binding protein